MKTYNVGVNPSTLAIRGRYGWVTNSNNYGISGADNVSVIDLHRKTTKLTVNDASFNQPYSLAIHKGLVYVCNSGGQTLTVIDEKTKKVVDVISGFDGPSGIAIKNDFAYVNNYGSAGGVGSGNGHTVSVLDLKSKNITTTIEVGLAPAALTIHGKNLYGVCYVDGNVGTGLLQIISLKTNTITGVIGGFSGPFDVVVSGKHAYVSNFGSNNFTP